MKLSTKFFIIGITLFTIIFSSCKKGDTGATGPKGVAGNANVQTYTVSINSWNLSSNSKYWYSDDTFISPLNFNITNSAVMVYWEKTSSNYIAMPITMSDIQYYFQYNSANNSSSTIEIDVSSASGNTVVPNPGTLNFKIVIIPPAMIKPNVNPHNYAEVKTAYNL